ncbi:MAG: hypothetical protein KatS3mg104_2502 [Phycisphaerae bacterium]|nr:MAG: hypothetical protein KatS3mg104_2502 [Phycisphaerae bacterium]
MSLFHDGLTQRRAVGKCGGKSCTARIQVSWVNREFSGSNHADTHAVSRNDGHCLVRQFVKTQTERTEHQSNSGLPSLPRFCYPRAADDQLNNTAHSYKASGRLDDEMQL